jgi:hypothetical protein
MREYRGLWDNDQEPFSEDLEEITKLKSILYKEGVRFRGWIAPAQVTSRWVGGWLS